jgi:hypothetical protein
MVQHRVGATERFVRGVSIRNLEVLSFFVGDGGDDYFGGDASCGAFFEEGLPQQPSRFASAMKGRHEASSSVWNARSRFFSSSLTGKERTALSQVSEPCAFGARDEL